MVPVVPRAGHGAVMVPVDHRADRTVVMDRRVPRAARGAVVVPVVPRAAHGLRTAQVDLQADRTVRTDPAVRRVV